MTFKKYTTLCFILSAVVLFSGCANSFSPASSTVEAAGPLFTKKSFIGQIGPIPDTTILTPSADGDYQVSISLNIPMTANPQGVAIGVIPVWTDELGAIDSTLPPFMVSGFSNMNGTNIQRNQITACIHAKAGTPIKVTGLQGGDSVNPYDVFVTVQPLQ